MKISISFFANEIRPCLKMAKFDSNPCSVCYENKESSLECHSVCSGCTKKHFKQECPVCRKKHFLPITGTPPSVYETLVPKLSSFDEKKHDSVPRSLAEIYAELRKKQKEMENDDSVSDISDISDISDDCSEEYDYDL